MGARFRCSIRKRNPIGEMPWSELLGTAGIGRKAQLELALGTAGQIQHHDALGGAIIQRHNAAKHALVIRRVERVFDLGKPLVAVGVELDLGV